MMNLHGVISNRLRNQYGNNVGNWPAARASDEIVNMPKEHYEGIELGGRPGRLGKQQLPVHPLRQC